MASLQGLAASSAFTLAFVALFVSPWIGLAMLIVTTIVVLRTD